MKLPLVYLSRHDVQLLVIYQPPPPPRPPCPQCHSRRKGSLDVLQFPWVLLGMRHGSPQGSSKPTGFSSSFCTSPRRPPPPRPRCSSALGIGWRTRGFSSVKHTSSLILLISNSLGTLPSLLFPFSLENLFYLDNR